VQRSYIHDVFHYELASCCFFLCIPPHADGH
jgi:hypothetical protein